MARSESVNKENKEKVQEIIGRLRELKTKNGYTLRMIAASAKVEENTVHGWFYDGYCPSVVSIARIAKEFHTSVDYIVNGDNSVVSKEEVCDTYDDMIRILEKKKKEFKSK